MDTKTTTRTRLTGDQRMYALALLARGDTLSQVAATLLQDHGVTITESALSQLRKSQAATIAKMQDTMVEAEAMDVTAILNKSRKAIAKKLDKADRDGNAIDELDRQYREGEITDPEDYRRRKAGLLKLSVSELNQISRTMFVQTRPAQSTPPDDKTPALPAGHLATPAQLESILGAIKRNDTVELQRIILTKA